MKHSTMLKMIVFEFYLQKFNKYRSFSARYILYMCSAHLAWGALHSLSTFRVKSITKDAECITVCLGGEIRVTTIKLQLTKVLFGAWRLLHTSWLCVTFCLSLFRFCLHGTTAFIQTTKMTQRWLIFHAMAIW